MGSEENKIFTREELKSRNTRKDIVLIIHNEVFNVTKFLDEHPGGEEVLLELGGKDATEQFEDVSHSSDARALMKQYKIGDIAESDRIESKASFAPQWSNDHPQEVGKLSSWVVPLVMAVVATLIYQYIVR